MEKENTHQTEISEKLKGLHVLFAEDNFMNIYVMEHLMKRWGIELSVAENGKEVLEKLNEKKFDLVLMDVYMPEMNGIDTTIQIRADKRFEHLPIIAITATSDEEMKKKTLEAGMNDFIMKPFNPDELLKTMLRYTK